MKKDKPIKCSKCKKIVSIRKIRKVNGGLLCTKCIQKNRKKHREFLLRKVCGVRKISDLKKEWAQKREFQKIEGSKPLIRIPTKIRGLSISKQERNVLYYKLKDKGLSEEAIKERISNLKNKLHKLVEKLKKKKESKEEINRRFKEEFAKLCNQ